MAKRSPKKPETDAEYFEYFQRKRIDMTKTIVIVSLISITCFGSLGYLLDLLMDTRPALLITMIAVSFPVTQIVIRKKLKNKIHE